MDTKEISDFKFDVATTAYGDSGLLLATITGDGIRLALVSKEGSIADLGIFDAPEEFFKDARVDSMVVLPDNYKLSLECP